MKEKIFYQGWIFFTSIVFLCFINGCNTKKVNTINWDDKEHLLTGEIMRTNNPFFKGLDNPVVFENYLITKYPNSESIFTLSQLRNDSLIYIGEFLSNGRGPAEMMSPNLFYIASSKQIVIYDNSNRSNKVFYINADSLENIFNTKSWKKINIKHIGELSDLYPLEDYTFLGMLRYGNNATNQMFFYIDTNRITGLNILYPEDNSGVTDFNIKYYAYQGTLKKHPYKNRFVYSAERNRYLHIFDYASDSLFSVSTPLSQYPNYTVNADGRNIHISSSDYFGSLSIQTTDRHIYLLMNDATYAHIREQKPINGHPWNYSNTVYVFDWEGNPIKKYILDHFAESFFIDSQDQYLYGNSDTTNGIELYRYKIL